MHVSTGIIPGDPPAKMAIMIIIKLVPGRVETAGIKIFSSKPDVLIHTSVTQYSGG